MKSYSCELVTKDGKHALVQRNRRGMELVVKQQQGLERPKVKVIECKSSVNQLIFLFKISEDTQYVPKVDNGVVKLEKYSVYDQHWDKSYYFQWKQFPTGSYYQLQSVAEPSKHLFVKDNKIILSSNKEDISLFRTWRVFKQSMKS